MALIGKIRKHFWFVLLLLGLALAAFIMMDMTGSGGPGGQQSNLTLGSVGGEKISYQDFQRTESAYFKNANIDLFQKRKSIWDYYVEKSLINKEADALGIDISRDEMLELQFGPQQSPIIQANWRDPNTGQVDMATLNQFRTAIENGDPLNPEFSSYWREQAKQIEKDAKQTKLMNIINKSVYTPTWMAEESFKQENTKADFKFVKIPYDQIPADGIELTDADFKSYMVKNPLAFEKDEETRIGKFASFDVVASEQDKSDIRANMLDLKREFLITKDDSIFATGNRGTYSHLYATNDQLPESARDSIANLQPGQIYGPFEESGFYMIVKLLDKRVVADSASAKHILRTSTRTDAASVATARAYIDSLERVYRAGGVSFEDLAKAHSQDPTAATNNGDLGTFTQSSMVREFSDACFLYGKKGGLHKVTTDYGVHLILIENQIFNNQDTKYRVSSIGQAIVPSQETQDAMYDKVSEIVAANRDLASLETALEGEDIALQLTPELKENDFDIAGLGSGQDSRDIIQWLFDDTNEIGELSPDVYRYTDKVNYFDSKYIIMGLDAIIPEGMKSINSVRDQIEVAVLNQKKGEKFVSGLNVSSLDQFASDNNVSVENATGIALSAAFVPGVGNEQEVIGAAHALEINAVSQPIVGTSGVIVVQPTSRQDASAPSNIPYIKQSLSTTTRSQVAFKIMENLKKRAKVEDFRSTFY